MPVFYLPATGFILSKRKKRTPKANNFSYTLSGKQSRIVGHAKKQSQITESQEKKKKKQRHNRLTGNPDITEMRHRL